jgi:hypothetical protein
VTVEDLLLKTIISYAKISLTDENHSQSGIDKEGVTYDYCFCWRNGHYLFNCHEAHIKKCNPINHIDEARE